MKKEIIIGINIIFFIAICIVGYFYFTKNPTEQTPTTPNTTTTGGVGIVTPSIPTQTEQGTTTEEGKYSSAKIDIKTTSGTVSVLNFYKNPQTRIIDPQGDADITETENYTTIFFPKFESFLITIEDGDIRKVRTEAEADFIKKLGITQEQACSLLVSVSVSRFADENAAGQDYGLSFCPNGIPMPANTGRFLERQQ